tara:strand:- start:4337 stop:4633 length:297 start_codon:yes stop_codon:yes gene_type:complete
MRNNNQIVGKSCSYSSLKNTGQPLPTLYNNHVGKPHPSDHTNVNKDSIVQRKKVENFPNRNNYNVPVYSINGYNSLNNSGSCSGYSKMTHAYGKPCDI